MKPFDTVNGAYICHGATIGIVGHVKIGNDCIIRENTVMGSVVVKPVDAKAIVKGNPAK